MKKWIVVVFALLIIFKLNAQASIGITVIVAPPPGAAITMDSYLWGISFANDGSTTYQNDHQGTMTIRSGSTWFYHVDFSSQNLGQLKQGSDYIPYSIKATAISNNPGLFGTPAIVAGYVQLTSTQSMWFIKKTPRNGIQFYIGIKINPVAGEFYESGSYSDTLTITFSAL